MNASNSTCDSSSIIKTGLLTGASLLTTDRFVHAKGDDTIRIALIGCGGRGSGAAAQAMNTPGKTKLVALADVDEGQLARSLSVLRKQQPDKVDVPVENQFLGFDSYKQALAECDVAILATPPGFRSIHFQEAVQQGKHCFLEKPVATDAPGIRRVLAAAKEAKKKGLKVGVGLQRRHQSAYEETVKRIQDGAIGEITSARCYWLGNSRDGKERLPGESEMMYQIRNWYYFTWLSGDHVVEQHIHNIDIINWAMGGYPVKAQGMGGRQVRKQLRHGQIFDHHMVEFEYANGAKLFSQSRQIRGCAPDVSEHLTGTLGRASMESGGKLYSITGPGAWQSRLKARENGHQLEHFPLFDAIRNNHEYNEAEIGAKSTMTAILGRMATYSGKMVNWDEAFASDLNLLPKEFGEYAIPPVMPDKDGWYPTAKPGKTKAW
ncbi:Gfo/Idh/MocA family oxidoreductase [Verrucomicrobia bacterium]|nr:Gfo/Idh/MocA family oxidoreductase [Verrucomicrobiota bacterium]